MMDNSDYIPKSARASKFDITFSKEVEKSSPERIKELKDNVASAKSLYEKALKNTVQQATLLEIEQMKIEEDNTVCEILKKVAEATNAAEGVNCDVHQKFRNIAKLHAKRLFCYCHDKDNGIINKYKVHHNQPSLPAKTVVMLQATYATTEAAAAARASYDAAAALPENKCLDLYNKALTAILVTPSHAYAKQREANTKSIQMKKLIAEMVDGKSTEDAAMELDTEQAVEPELLKELIWKECDKRDSNYKKLQNQYNQLQKRLDSIIENNSDKNNRRSEKNSSQRGRSTGASANKNKSDPRKKRGNRQSRSKSRGHNDSPDRNNNNRNNNRHSRRTSRDRHKHRNRSQNHGAVDESNRDSDDDNNARQQNHSNNRSNRRKSRSRTKPNRR